MRGIALPWPVLVLRILGSILLTGLIGFERETQDRPAGLRTHMLVGLAATSYSVTTLYLVGQDHPESIQMDPIRLVEAVTSGVAFLAAGLIVFARGEVRGLTTGASLWLAASVGLAVGLGLWGLALLVTGLSLFVVRVLGEVEKRWKRGPGAGTRDRNGDGPPRDG